MLKHINKNGFYTRDYEPSYITVSDDAIEAAVTLTEKFMTDKFLPDKATGLISKAVSYYQDLEERAKDSETKTGPIKQIKREDIAGCLYDAIKHLFKNPILFKEEFIKGVFQKN